jgi:hypothetical protein
MNWIAKEVDDHEQLLFAQRRVLHAAQEKDGWQKPRGKA